jgi:hypothetical protein
MLNVEIEALKTQGIELALLGFSEGEFSALADKLARELRLDDEDAAPAVSKDAVTRAGDVWELAEHRLLCADAIVPESYGTLLEGQVCHMVFSDLPYNVAYEAPEAPDGSPRHARITNDDLGKNFGAFLETACKQMLLHTRGALYICMSSSELHTLYTAFTKAGGHWSTFIIWAKSTFTLGGSDYHRRLSRFSTAGAKVGRTTGAEAGAKRISGISTSLTLTNCIQQ